MGKHSMKIDLLAPAEKYIINLGGKHPSKLLKTIPQHLMLLYRVQTSSFWEDKIKWDKSNPDVEKFFGQWRLKDTKDVRSKVWVWVTIQGEQKKSDLMGEVVVYIKGYLFVDIEHSGPIEEALKLMHLRTFYGDQIQKYTQEGRKKLMELNNKFRDDMGLELSEADTGEGR